MGAQFEFGRRCHPSVESAFAWFRLASRPEGSLEKVSLVKCSVAVAVKGVNEEAALAMMEKQCCCGGNIGGVE